MEPVPTGQNATDQASGSTLPANDPLDDLEFASDSGFVGVIQDETAGRVEDCVEPG